GALQLSSSQQACPWAPQGSGAPPAPPPSVVDEPSVTLPSSSPAPPAPAAPLSPAAPLLPVLSVPAALEVVLVDVAGVPPLPVKVAPVTVVAGLATSESSPPQAANRTKVATAPRTKADSFVRKRIGLSVALK